MCPVYHSGHFEKLSAELGTLRIGADNAVGSRARAVRKGNTAIANHDLAMSMDVLILQKTAEAVDASSLSVRPRHMNGDGHVMGSVSCIRVAATVQSQARRASNCDQPWIGERGRKAGFTLGNSDQTCSANQNEDKPGSRSAGGFMGPDHNSGTPSQNAH